ncbi:FecCD family ABC transporter permease [Marinomonas mediterranea]|uniref:ABC-type transporter, integral membrane subunit n=1 Tax=Marinomonas mediterranea (strain ATCC 700492 / JCM 21426 / NBRC 103028 / MMB-1) TaxID=717774 RepID=F2K4E1_MARM1|nr:iron ABC transporter permease [Marinomonas mediterranea]ADZ90240.1 ABC-type transporter, integral membrane subunit [Marinomonas mediterranea MMB-1]WCN16432.1 iron chelate uptake ABC transporter family permease subunit [Marinomonas mediterranea MMB-1]
MKSNYFSRLAHFLPRIFPTSPTPRLVNFNPIAGVNIRARSTDVFWLFSFTVLLLFILLWGTATGSYQLSLLKSWQIVLSPDSAPERLVRIVWEFRLPRLLAAALCGAALAIAGVILQSITRNALASPGLIGVEAGASATMLLFVVIMPGLIPISLLPFSAMLGGFSVAALIWILSTMAGYSPIRLVLVGVGITSMLSAFSEMLITYGDIELVESALMWLGGSLHQVSWAQVEIMVWWLLVPGLLAWLFFRPLNLLILGDQVAFSRGVVHRKIIPFLLLLSVALTSASVATAGTLTFVGLIAPHIARRFCADRHGALIPLSALIGACLVALGDTLGRNVFAPLQLPAGLVLVMVGAPYFIVLMSRLKKV